MRNDKLNIGTRKNGGRVISVEVSIPETDVEIATVTKTEATRARLIERALRIELQERSGARDIIENAPASDFESKRDDEGNVVNVCKAGSATAKAIAEAIKNYDPSAERKRGGRPAGPKSVEIAESDLKSAMKDPSKLAALLAAQGVKLNLK